MKLNSIAQKHEVSMEELLQFENNLLQKELEIVDIERSIELMETIKDCIEKEGGVSASIEMMFGENFSSSENALNELNDILSQSYEGLFNKALELAKNASVKASFMAMANKIKAITKEDLKDVKFPLTINIPRRAIQGEIFTDAMEQCIRLAKEANAENLEKINETGKQIASDTVKAVMEAKPESATINSAEEFMRYVNNVDKLLVVFNKRWPELQKSLWGMESKMSKLMGEKKEAIPTKIRSSMVLYRCMLRIAMQSGRAILSAIGK